MLQTNDVFYDLHLKSKQSDANLEFNVIKVAYLIFLDESLFKTNLFYLLSSEKLTF